MNSKYFNNTGIGVDVDVVAAGIDDDGAAGIDDDGATRIAGATGICVGNGAGTDSGINTDVHHDKNDCVTDNADNVDDTDATDAAGNAGNAGNTDDTDAADNEDVKDGVALVKCRSTVRNSKSNCDK